MTVIVYDGKVLAADKQSTNAGLKRRVTKIRKIYDCLYAVTGDWDRAQALFDWVQKGKPPEGWPESQKSNDDWVGLLEIRPDGSAWKYERVPVPMKIEDLPFAMGSGRDFAYGALSMGADAVTAVRIACDHDNGCGMGVDTLKIGVA